MLSYRSRFLLAFLGLTLSSASNGLVRGELVYISTATYHQANPQPSVI